MSDDENDGGRTEEEGLWKRMEFAISFFFWISGVLLKGEFQCIKFVATREDGSNY